MLGWDSLVPIGRRSGEVAAELSVEPESGGQLDLYRYVEGQLRESDRTAGVATYIAEDLDQQIRASVDYCRGLVEAGRNIDHPKHLDDAAYAVKIT